MREFCYFWKVSYEGHMLVSLTIYILAGGEMTIRNKKKYIKKSPLKIHEFRNFREFHMKGHMLL